MKEQIAMILNAVSIETEISQEFIKSRFRKRAICEARHISSYLMRAEGIATAIIGLELGYKDHSGAIDGYTKIISLLSDKKTNEGKRIQELVKKIERRLGK